MSGIVGIFQLNGAPIDQTLLARLTNSLAHRGPDAQRIWCRGPIGLGHTLLQSAIESQEERQPLSLDNNLYIVADARIDGRRDLIAALRSHGQICSETATDAELILRAYTLWGDACAERLIGDFTFAIWNARTRRLFCARDHFGIKPFFYAQIGHSLVFSNTLDCVRRYPGVSDRLNEIAIGDFLLLDTNHDLGTTVFSDILRLPPAHTLHCQDGKLKVTRYWRLPEAKIAREFRRREECLEQFREVFDSAVSDRLRGSSAGIFLSGGLDSPTVAASARRVLKRRNSSFDFRAYSIVHDTLIPHDERHYAGLVAKALDIPIQFAPADNCRLFDNYDDPNYRTPEPMHFPMGFRNFDPYAEIEKFSRTALTGYGGDPTLGSFLSGHFRRLFRDRHFGRMVSDAVGFLGAEGRFSRLYVKTRLRRLFGKKGIPQFHSWLNPDFVQRSRLRERWEGILAETESNSSVRPEAYTNVSSRMWTLTFEPFDPASIGYRVESCHPFFDLRVLDFLLALPALPWCSDKELLRQVDRGVMPDAVRLRKKSPLRQDPIVALLHKPEAAWVDTFAAVPELNEFVQRDRVPQAYQAPDSATAWSALKPLSLNFWLERRDVSRPSVPASLHTYEDAAAAR